MIPLISVLFAGLSSAVASAQIAHTKHEVLRANTLWDLAQHYCRDPLQWPLIYEANRAQIKDPHWIYPGQVFTIPCAEKVSVYPKTETTPASPEALPAPLEPERVPPQPQAPAQAPVQPAPVQENLGPDRMSESLSVEMPEGMTEQQISIRRVQMPKDWKPEGRVVEFEGRDRTAARGDFIRVRIKDAGSIEKGQRYEVYRRAAATEADLDQEGNYLQEIGLIEITRKVSKREFIAVILKSGGTVQTDDLLNRAS